MTDDNALAPLAPSQTRRAGGARATFALFFSILALGASGYALWLTMQDRAPAVVAPLVRESTDHGAGQEKAARTAQEKAVTALQDEIRLLKESFAALSAQTAEAKAAVPVPVLPVNTEAMEKIQQKLVELEARTSVGQSEIQADVARKARSLIALAMLDETQRHMEQGLSFSDDVAEMEANLPANEAMQQSFDALKKAATHPLSSDVQLKDGLRSLQPDFLAKEKMAAADNAFDKVLIQLQKLVVIRPKDGRKPSGSPVADALAALEQAIITHDWAKARTLAGTFADKGPKDFPAWHAMLRARADAEELAQVLRKGLLADMQPVPEKSGVQP